MNDGMWMSEAVEFNTATGASRPARDTKHEPECNEKCRPAARCHWIKTGDSVTGTLVSTVASGGATGS